MTISDFAGKAQTVLGLIDPEDLGVTLPHEHLIMDHVEANFTEPEDPEDRVIAHKPVCMETLNWLRYHHMENIDNMTLLDEEEAIEEAMQFKKAGGGAIVELTNIGGSRNPAALARISKATGLHIIMGSGYYVAPSHPANISQKSEDEIVEEIVREVNVGVDNTSIRAGMIGEIGASWPLHENEAKSIRASARAQQLTGAPLNIHPGRVDNTSALEIVDILIKANADLTKTVISHIDARVRDHNVRCEIAKTGCYLEYDVFGWEGIPPTSQYKDSSIKLPSDMQRIYEIMQLIEEGFLNQILISHDVCYKTWRARYGGKGFTHISKHIVPVMLNEGITQEQIDTIMIDNPKRLLSFV